MDLSQKLVQLGFTKNQVTVYEALIELGQCKASEIIKKTGLHRNIVYESLDELLLKHLAFKTSKGGVALFQLSDASTLVSEAERTLSTAQDVAQEINSRRQKSKHEIKLYEGITGLSAHRDALVSELAEEEGERKELLVLGTSVKGTADLYDSFWKKENERRARMGIPARMLFAEQNEYYAQLANTVPLTSTRLLSPDFRNPSSIEIWKDSTAFLLLDSYPFIVSIQNAELANSFRNYFENLWKQNTFVTSGLKEVQALVMRKLEEMNDGDEYDVLWSTYGEDDGAREEIISFFHTHDQARVEKKVRVQTLGFEEDRAVVEEELRVGGQKLQELLSVRYLDGVVGTPMEIAIYTDFILVLYWSKEAFAIEIQNKQVRDAMKLYFDAMWHTAKE